MKIQRDKLMHFGVCAIVSVLAMILMRVIAAPLAVAALSAILISVCLGVGKEYGDMANPYNSWDWKDFLADVVGAVIGTAAMMPLWLI